MKANVATKNLSWMSIFTRCLLLTILVFIPTAMAENPPRLIAANAIEVFVREGCPHCAKAEAFVQTLKQEQPELQIVVRDISREPAALDRLKQLTDIQGINAIRVPAFYLHDQLITGYSDELTTGRLIRETLKLGRQQAPHNEGSCEAVNTLSCEAEATTTNNMEAQHFEVNFIGHQLTLEQIGLPLFTIVMGLLDGFNPCSMWVLILMISLLAPMQNRPRMLAVAGAFVAVEGIAYFVFMTAWLNLFLLIGLSRLSEIIIAGIALLAGAINLKDFWAYGWGVSLSIPESAKPGIYSRIRKILLAESLWGAMIAAVVLAVLVQIVELVCTSGFPALYTRILTLNQLSGFSYYSYLLLYNAAYMFDDLLVLSVGVITLSQRRLQEKQGRWLKLISGLVMVGLGVYLLIEK